MKKSKKEMQNQISAKQNVVSNKLSDHQTKDVSGGAIGYIDKMKKGFKYALLDDNGKIIRMSNSESELEYDNSKMKSRKIKVIDEGVDEYVNGGGVNGIFGKRHIW